MSKGPSIFSGVGRGGAGNDLGSAETHLFKVYIAETDAAVVALIMGCLLCEAERKVRRGHRASKIPQVNN